MARRRTSKPTALVALMLTLLCVSCDDPARTPEIVRELKDSKDKNTGLVFRIARHDVRADGSQTLSAAGLLHGRPVGFELELAPWRENPPGYVNMSTWQCTAHLSSQGTASDELLRFMDSIYETHLAPKKMTDSIELQALSPWRDPGDFHAARANLILLQPSRIDDSRDTPEVLLDVDAKAARVYLREKDKRRRNAVISALSASP
jgi:hypothetical protein